VCPKVRRTWPWSFLTLDGLCVDCSCLEHESFQSSLAKRVNRLGVSERQSFRSSSHCFADAVALCAFNFQVALEFVSRHRAEPLAAKKLPRRRAVTVVISSCGPSHISNCDTLTLPSMPATVMPWQFAAWTPIVAVRFHSYAVIEQRTARLKKTYPHATSQFHQDLATQSQMSTVCLVQMDVCHQCRPSAWSLLGKLRLHARKAQRGGNWRQWNATALTTGAVVPPVSPSSPHKSNQMFA
jgi:hypothetical protein